MFVCGRSRFGENEVLHSKPAFSPNADVALISRLTTLTSLSVHGVGHLPPALLIKCTNLNIIDLSLSNALSESEAAVLSQFRWLKSLKMRNVPSESLLPALLPLPPFLKDLRLPDECYTSKTRCYVSHFGITSELIFQ